MKTVYYNIDSMSEWVKKYGRLDDKLQIATSSHANAPFISAWIKDFIDQQNKYKKSYSDFQKTLANAVLYSRLYEEAGSEKFVTALKNEETYATPISIVENSQKQFVDINTPILRRGLMASNQEENRAWIRDCFDENPDGTKQMIQNVYHSFIIENGFDEKSILNLLSLLKEFDYEEMMPVGFIILTSSISLKSEEIKDEALGVLDHWPCRSTYNLLKKLTPPGNFLTQIKYQSILSSFEERYGVSAQD